MTDQFKNVKKHEQVAKTAHSNKDVEIFVKEPSDIEKIIEELEALSAKSFKDGNLIAHYTLNTAIEIVKKHP